MNKILLTVTALLFFATEAVAATNLYTGEVYVVNQGEPERNEVIPDALIQVLQKLTGRRDMPASPALDAALNDASRLLHSYRYKNVERTAPDGVMTQELRLVARFREAEVDDLVQQAGLPRWQKERPAVQIWVVIDDGLSRELKPLEFEYAWESMQEIAALRGLPIEWPELDEEEAQLVDMRLLWGGFTDYLVERGAPADGVVIIAARREGPQWTLRWNLASGAQSWSWRSNDQELMFALAQGIHTMTDEIASTNTIAASEQGVWMLDLSIGELNSETDYSACLEYLQGLSLVSDVDVVGADPGRVHFRLRLNASAEHLTDVFDRGSVLLRASAGRDYDYELLPWGSGR